MGDGTKIEWTDATWNPVLGCTHVSSGCDNCYAAREASGRLSVHPLYAGLAEGGKFNGTVRLVPERLTQPLRWRKPRRVFVNSMSDLFHDAIPDGFIASVFAAMSLAQRHTFQILTKRHGRLRSLLNRPDWRRLCEDAQIRLNAEAHAAGARTRYDFEQTRDQWWSDFTKPLRNVWLGVSVEDQRTADIRVPKLLETPAAVRWLSCEPLLSRVDLTRVRGNLDVLSGDVLGSDGLPYAACPSAVDWVVVGGESGPKARPMRPEWARALRDQTTAAGRAFLFKQWGEWAPSGFEIANRATDWVPREELVRVGKHKAGREMDGRTWDEYPAGAR